jgi:hypothetical protein
MKSNQKKYLDKVVGLIVRDTRIDYDQDRIYFPFLPFPYKSLSSPPLTFSFPLPSIYFSDYCKDNYGLTEDEIKYVWDQYKTIIKEKIRNNE